MVRYALQFLILIAVGQEHHAHIHQIKYLAFTVCQMESVETRKTNSLIIQSFTSMWSVLMAAVVLVCV